MRFRGYIPYFQTNPSRWGYPRFSCVRLRLNTVFHQQKARNNCFCSSQPIPLRSFASLYLFQRSRLESKPGIGHQRHFGDTPIHWDMKLSIPSSLGSAPPTIRPGGRARSAASLGTFTIFGIAPRTRLTASSNSGLLWRTKESRKRRQRCFRSGSGLHWPCDGDADVAICHSSWLTLDSVGQKPEISPVDSRVGRVGGLTNGKRKNLGQIQVTASKSKSCHRDVEGTYGDLLVHLFLESVMIEPCLHSSHVAEMMVLQTQILPRPMSPCSQAES